VNSQSGSTGARTLIIEKGTTVNVNSGGYLGDSSVTNYTAPNVNGTTIGVGNAAAGGTLVVKPGGTVTAGNNTQVIVGLAAAASGTLTIDGGDVNGGAITTLSGGGPVLPAAYGGLRFGGSTGNTGGTRIANLNGGTLTVGQVFIGALAVGSTATNTLNFNGGTLKAIISNTTFMTGLTAANVQVGGAKINTNGFDITVGQALIHDPALVATPDGGLIKSGSGTLTLTAANTYDGGTTISEGKLLLSGSGSLAAAGAVSLASGTTVEKTNTSAQVLSGPVTGNGTLKLPAGGVFNLQNSGNSFGALEISNSGARVFINNSASALPSAATVDVAAGLLVFGVASNNNNAITVSSGAGICARVASTLSNVTLPGSGSVIFNNDDANTASLTISNGLALAGTLTVQLGGTRMLAAGGAIGGADLSGNLTGSGSLVMASSGNIANPNFGTGVLTLSGSNTYSGDTTVNSGTLRLSNAPNPLNANSGNDASTVTIAASDATLDLTYTGTDKVAKLIIGATQLADGVYGKTGSISPIIGISQITGDGTLTVSSAPAAGYPSWASINGAGANLNDDHDNDGVSNGVEYFIGGPTLPTANTTGFTSLPGVTSNTVTWTKASAYAGAYGTDIVVETSTTLAGVWGTAALGAGANQVVFSGNTVTYTFPAGTKNFARLRVTGP
jgi:autotransporter-associated beta strand protein